MAYMHPAASKPMPPMGIPAFAGEDDFSIGCSVASSEAHVRVGFLRKVFGIVAAQLTLTAVVSAVCMLSSTAQSVVLHNPSMMMLTFFSSLGFLFACQCYKDQHPTNLYLLGGFTLSMSWSVGAVCALYATQGLGMIVLQAVCLTAAITAGLTAYTLKSKQDFFYLGAGLSAALFVLILGSLVAPLTGSPVMHVGIAVAGAAIFSLYIVFDVYMISRRLSPDEYIPAAIALYLDIVNLFLHILRILAEMRSD